MGVHLALLGSSDWPFRRKDDETYTERPSKGGLFSLDLKVAGSNLLSQNPRQTGI